MVQDQILLNDWHVIARSQDLQPGTVLHKRLLGSDLVLWHNGDKVLAWQDLCPHRGARLSLGYVNKQTLVCSYHGLAFNSEGKCILAPANPDQSPPARACVKTYQVLERYDLLWVCLGTPKQDMGFLFCVVGAIGYCHCNHKMSKLLALCFQTGLLELCALKPVTPKSERTSIA